METELIKLMSNGGLFVVVIVIMVYGFRYFTAQIDMLLQRNVADRERTMQVQEKFASAISENTIFSKTSHELSMKAVDAMNNAMEKNTQAFISFTDKMEMFFGSNNKKRNTK